MNKKKTILAAVAVSIGLVLFGLATGNANILANLLFIAALIIVVPPFYYKYQHYRWVRNIEDQFTNLVRDLADSRRSGMSFPQSIKIATKANYGKLSPEVQRMHNKLSWGIPFLRVLEMFQSRVRASKIIAEAVTIIKESYQAGGNVANTLEAIASDINMLKETEAERVSLLKQNVMIMYGIFFMFLGIAIMIVYVMVPMVQAQPTTQTGTFGFSFDNPCRGQEVFPCNLFRAVSVFLGVPEGIASYYISVFLMVVIIQGLFTGLIVGQLGEGSIAAGTKHSMIMVFSGIGTFIFLVRTGLLPVM